MDENRHIDDLRQQARAAVGMTTALRYKHFTKAESKR